ncbi:glycosyltransferase [Oceanibacterium hippocampi]|uniref:2-deoxystreptamine N-acetyl-D-glucosaminyltransferase n=1 Tax=Oceanibacterium hippocampi TaxID=745714 RepID=A0A1Y5TTG8_9PROT|nr:glycosyltransferase [Oceanibacterium hippocampi]SLN69299.1 2-deoxystreptamine N-acetyl-D-glucosaminyltransferase [Oceanibacterium hippocampi]
MAAREYRLLHAFSTFAFGGPEVRFTVIANALAGRYRHDIVSMDSRFDCAELLAPRVSFEKLTPDVRKGGGLSLGNLRRFRQLLKERKPDLLVTYNWGAMEWALANRLGPRLPHLHFEDGFGPEEANGRQIPRRVHFRRHVLPRATVVVPSTGLERIATETWRLPARNVLRIVNGVDINRFATANPVAIPGLPDGVPVIGSVGALRGEKNFARLIEAFADIEGKPDVHLVLVGEGGERAALENLASVRGVAERVIFTGRMNAPEGALRRFDVFALSSDTEQMPISLLEAMAAGLPAVSTDVGDVKAMLAERNRRFVVAREDRGALTAALSMLLERGDLRHALGAANRARVDAEFSESAMTNRYDTLFRELIGV